MQNSISIPPPFFVCDKPWDIYFFLISLNLMEIYFMMWWQYLAFLTLSDVFRHVFLHVLIRFSWTKSRCKIFFTKKNVFYSMNASENMGKYLPTYFNIFLSTIMVGQQVYIFFIKWAIIFERKPYYLNIFLSLYI